jgi:hypothetical protein
MSFRIVSTCVLVAAIACGNPPVVSSGAAAGVEPAPAPNRDRNLITQAELSDPSIRAQSVLSVIRTMRPHFLVERGKNSHSDDEAGKVHVSVDNGRIVPLSELENIHAGTVQEIRYLDIAAAMRQFGGAAREGPVILIRLAR